jgi:hypothetical protein
MDTASAKKYNQKVGFRPDPVIAFFDALAANASFTKIMKLPKVPNTKGKYLAQYMDTTGTCEIYHGWGERKKYFVIYRVLPTGVVKYFIEADSKNFKNTNSRNHYLVGDLGKIYKNILDYREGLDYDSKTAIQLVEFRGNLDRLIESKKDTTLTLRKVVSAITGKTCMGFDASQNEIEAGLKKLSQLRNWISDMEYSNQIKYKK